MVFFAVFFEKMKYTAYEKPRSAAKYLDRKAQPRLRPESA
jgi:hypothetical protein